LTLGLAAAALLLVIGGGASAWVIQQHREATRFEAQSRRQRADDLTHQAVARGHSFLQDGWRDNDKRALDDAWAEAEKAVEFARHDASPDIRQEAEVLQGEVRAKLGQWRKNDKLRTALLDVVIPREIKQYTRSNSGTVIAEPTEEQRFAEAFRVWDASMDIDRDPLDELTARLGGQPKPEVEQVVVSLDEWTLLRKITKSRS
jgi:hypothetical protein